MRLLALVTAALLLPQEKNEAEALFKKMEEKILQAKTIQVKVKGTRTDENGKEEVTADVLLGAAEGDQMKATILIGFALLLPQEKNEAEELFKRMEDKIAKAKAVHLKATGEMDMMKFSLSGEMNLGEGGKMRVELEGQSGEREMKASLVSDGKRLRLESTDKGKPREFDISDKLTALSRACLARGGFLGTLDSFDNEKSVNAEADDLFAASAFKMGAREKVGERDAQSVEYKLDKKGHRTTEAAVWIDVETRLPLKRTLKKGPVTLTETYSDFTLDEKIDPAKFELPKPAK